MSAVGPFGPVGPKTITVDGDPSDWTGTVPLADTGVASNGEFVWNDTVGDDTGNGTYTYPTDAVFVPGNFDLTQVRVTADADNLFFLIKLANLTNPGWVADPGISLQKIGIFIDTGTGGATAADPNLITGSGFEFQAIVAQATWQAANAKVFNSTGAWWPIAYAANSTTDSIEASIPLQFLGDPSGQTWGFYVWLGGQAGDTDPSGIRGWRDVTAAGGQWVFGGGADHQFDPAVIDVAFSLTQALELNSFTTSSKATVSSNATVTFGSLGFVADATPPGISAVSAIPSFNRATVQWTTDELATTKVQWGTATGQLTNTVTVDDVTSSHAVVITGLTPVNTYYYRVASTDVAGNVNQSSERTFTTTAPPQRNFAEWIGNTFHWADNFADDVGDGGYTYPMNGGILRWVGKADLRDVNITKEANWLHFNIRNNANPTPNSDTDWWRQRMAAVAVFIDGDRISGSGARDVDWLFPGDVDGTGTPQYHNLSLSVSPDFAWEYLVVADFQNRTRVDGTPIGEMAIFNSTKNPVTQLYGLQYLSYSTSGLPKPTAGMVYARDGVELDLWLNLTSLAIGTNLTLNIAGALYDDAARTFAQGGYRQVEAVAGDWVGGGGADGTSNPNVYDLAFYPTQAVQITDLSSWTTTSLAALTHGMQIDFTAKWFSFRTQSAPPTHSYTTSVSSNLTQLQANEEATITVTFTDKGVAVVGAQVSIAITAGSGAGSLVGSTVKTTDSQGRVTFTFRAGTVSTDTTVTFTATATNDTATSTGTATVTVKAPAPAPPAPSGLDALTIGIIALVIVVVVAALVFLVRARKKPGAGAEKGEEEGGEESQGPPP